MRQPKRKTSIGFRITILVVSLMVFASILDIVTSTRWSRRVLMEELDAQGRSLARSAAIFSIEPLLARDFPVLDTYGATLVQESFISCIRVQREDGRIVAEFPVAWTRESVTKQGARLFERAVSVENPPREIGRVTIGVSTERLEATIAERQQAQIARAIAIYPACALLLILVLSRLVSRRLERLDVTARKLGEGDLETPVVDPGRDEIGQLAGSLDEMRSKLGRSYHDLDEQNRELKRLSRVKDEFLANISHELRTPLNGIIGMAEVLLMEGLARNQAECVHTITSAADHLCEIIDDILDFSRLVEDDAPVRAVEFDPRALLQAVIARFTAQAEKKSLKLSWRCDDAVPERVEGGEARIRQILIHLVRNAMTFTESGSVEISADVLSRENRKIVIRFAVSDTGMGVAPEKREFIFQPFTQSDGSMSRPHGGTGLGLAICSRAAELLGGPIRLESELGVGSTFSFTTSVSVLERAPRPARAARDAVLEGLHVLLVEDNRTNLAVAGRLLETLGCSVTPAANGREAVDAVRSEPVDIVLMDWQMPEMDGITATREIRRLESNRETRTIIVALTAHAMEHHRQECLDAGMDDFLAKPIDRDRLADCLGRWAARAREARRELA